MKLTKKAFEAWLKSFPPDEVVGTVCEVRSCPLAKWLGNPVLSSRWNIADKHWETMPRWARLFRFAVDSNANAPNVSVTAKQALEILRGIK